MRHSRRKHPGATRAVTWSRRAAPAWCLAAVALLAAACSSGPSGATKATTDLAGAIAAEQVGNYALCETDAGQVIVVAPDNNSDDAYAYYNRALCEQLQGNLTAAEQDYDRALALNPNFVSALYNLAIVVTHSDPQRAVDLYLQAIRLDPTNASAHLNLGFLYASMGNRSEAISSFRQAVRYNPAYVTRIPSALRATVLGSHAASSASSTTSTT